MGCTRQSEAVRATALDGSWLTFGLRKQAHPSLVWSLSFTFKRDPTGHNGKPGRRVLTSETVLSHRINTLGKVLLAYFSFYFFFKTESYASILNRETPRTRVKWWKFNTRKLKSDDLKNYYEFTSSPEMWHHCQSMPRRHWNNSDPQRVQSSLLDVLYDSQVYYNFFSFF